MNENTKNFIIKVVVSVVAVLVLYFTASPYQSCLRNKNGSNVEFVCAKYHSW